MLLITAISSREPSWQHLPPHVKELRAEFIAQWMRSVVVDSSRPHSAAGTVETIYQFSWKQLPHPSYGLDWATSGFYLFGPIKKISVSNKAFKRWWSEEYCEQMAKNSVQRFLYWRNIKGCLLRGKKVLKNGD